MRKQQATKWEQICVSKKGKPMLKVYPSVSSGVLTIVREDSFGKTAEIADFQVFKLSGQQALNGKTGQCIDVSALSKGTYIVKVGLEQALFIKR
jgi:hypothetical protein